MFALDLATGKKVWAFVSPGDLPAYTPAIVGGLAIVDSEDHSVTGLDAATGAVRWQVPVTGVDEIVPAVADSTVYTASNGGPAVALDLKTGAERWSVPIEGVPYGMAVTSRSRPRRNQCRDLVCDRQCRTVTRGELPPPPGSRRPSWGISAGVETGSSGGP